MATKSAKNSAPTAESETIETYIVRASMVGKYPQNAVVQGDELKAAGYKVESLLNKKAIEVFDPAKAEEEAAAKAQAAATPFERALQQRVDELSAAVQELLGRVEGLEAALPKEEAQA